MKIRIQTIKDGGVVLDKVGRPGVSVDAICEIAQHEVNGGYADYARVSVDNKIYAEYVYTDENE